MTIFYNETVTFLIEMVVMFKGLDPPKKLETKWFEMVIDL